MKILIIDDDAPKREKIKKFIMDQFPDSLIEMRTSYNSGLSELEEQSYPLVLLDMSMPLHDQTGLDPGKTFHPYAGRELIDDIDRLDIKTKVVIVTQFETFGEGRNYQELPELQRQIAERHPTIYLDTIHYTATNDSWMKRLEEIIRKVERSHNKKSKKRNND